MLMGLTLLHSTHRKCKINLFNDFQQRRPSFVMNKRHKRCYQNCTHTMYDIQGLKETNLLIATLKVRCYDTYSVQDCCVIFSGTDLAFIFTILLLKLIRSAKFISSLLNSNYWQIIASETFEQTD